MKKENTQFLKLNWEENLFANFKYLLILRCIKYSKSTKRFDLSQNLKILKLMLNKIKKYFNLKFSNKVMRQDAKPSFEVRMNKIESYFKKQAEENELFLPEYNAIFKINKIALKEEILESEIYQIVSIFNSTNLKDHYNGTGWLDLRMHVKSLIEKLDFECEILPNKNIEIIGLEKHYSGDKRWSKFVAFHSKRIKRDSIFNKLLLRLNNKEDIATVIFSLFENENCLKYIESRQQIFNGLSPEECLISNNRIKRLKEVLMRFPI